MNYSSGEQAGYGVGAQRQKALPSSEAVSVEQLSRAVGQHALLQAEIDRRIALHIVQMREDLRSAKDEVCSLRAQLDQLIGNLAQALGSTVGQQAHRRKRAASIALR
jgi:hypothetical protein